MLSEAESAATVAGISLESVQLVKFSNYDDKISLLSYPGFDTESCPKLARSWTVYISSGKVTCRTYNQDNAPILHRKELLVGSSYPNLREFEQLTEGLEDIGMFDEPTKIGFSRRWEQMLKNKGYMIEGHVLKKIEESDG
jgi:DNA phosphorothioation-associated putative methyltransferase